jgi:hypothetical protein
MWVVVIIVLLVLVGARERVIGIMMGLLVVPRTKDVLWTDGVFVCRECMMVDICYSLLLCTCSLFGIYY